MYDAVVIGGGPGGYVCAIKLAQLGGKVVLVERGELGGVCTNYGCIPTKSLHASCDILKRAKAAKAHGINLHVEGIDFSQMRKRMQLVVNNLRNGIGLLLKSNSVEVLNGEGKIFGKNSVEVNGKILETKNIVIATGSEPIGIPGVSFGESVLSSTELLALEKIPSSLMIIGAGVIGMEFACIFNELGTKVTVMEMLDRILPTEDMEIASELQKTLERDGIEFLLGSKVEKIEGNRVFVSGKELEAEKVLVAIGRRPVFDKEAMEKLGVKFGKKGILVNDKMQTNLPNIYAIGDVAGGMLAHVASEQGVTAAQNIMGKNSEFEKHAISWCVFSMPEIASVGELNGDQVGKFPFSASGKASALGERTGFVKILARNGVIVGGTIIGPHASDLIGELALAVRNKLKLEDIEETIHPHPTLCEAIQEAVRAANKRAVHLPKQ